MKQLSLMCVLCLLLVGQPAQGGEEKQNLLSVGQAVALALENNLGLKISRQDVGKAEAAVQAEKGTFDPVIQATGFHQDARSTPTSAFDASREETTSWTVGVKKRLQAGADLDFTWDNSRYSSDLSFLTIDPVYGSGLSLGVSQPLWQGRGKEVQTAAIRARQKEAAATGLSADSRAVELAARVKEAYWELVYARQDIEVKKLALRLAESLLDDTKKKIDAGALAGVAIYQPESEVARREEALISGERVQANLEDSLKLLLNLSDWSQPLVPTDLPQVDSTVPDMGAVTQKALATRPDIRAAARLVDAAVIKVKLAENTVNPSLDLIGRLGLAGTDGRYDSAVGAVAGDSDVTWKVGLAFSLPLGNNRAKAGVTAARVELRKARYTLQQLRQEAVRAARQAVREISLSLKSIRASAKTALALKKRLEAEKDKFDVGLATALDVLEDQEAYARAVAGEKRAAVDHAIARARLARVRGSL